MHPLEAAPAETAEAARGGYSTRSRQSCLFRMRALLGPEVQSKVSGKVTFVGRKNSLFAQPKRLAHNSLVGGLSHSPLFAGIFSGSNAGGAVSAARRDRDIVDFGSRSLSYAIPFLALE